MNDDAQEIESVEDDAPEVVTSLDDGVAASESTYESEIDESSAAEEENEEIVVFDADAEDAAEEALLRASIEKNRQASENPEAADDAPGVRNMAELMAIAEALIFVAGEPLSVKSMADLLKEDKGWVQTAVEALAAEF